MSCILIYRGLGFRLFCKIVQTRFNVPSRFTIIRDCLKVNMEKKEKIKENS
jgi:hypothetical protein